MAEHFPCPNDHYIGLQQFILKTKNVVKDITKSICLCKGSYDDAIYQRSIDYMANNVKSEHVETYTYEQSSHLITLGNERDQLTIDVKDFVHAVYKSKVFS